MKFMFSALSKSAGGQLWLKNIIESLLNWVEMEWLDDIENWLLLLCLYLQSYQQASV